MKKVRWKSKRANKSLREETERDHIKPHALSSLSPLSSYLLPSSSLPLSFPKFFSLSPFFSSFLPSQPPFQPPFLFLKQGLTPWPQVARPLWVGRDGLSYVFCVSHLCLVFGLLHSSIHVGQEILGDWAWGAVAECTQGSGFFL